MRKFYRPEHNTKGGRDPMELNFEGLEMQKWNTQTNRAQRVDGKKWGHFSSYHVCFPSYDNWNVKNGSFFVFSADASEQSVTVWTIYLFGSERSYRSYLALQENAMDSWILSYH